MVDLSLLKATNFRIITSFLFFSFIIIIIIIIIIMHGLIINLICTKIIYSTNMIKIIIIISDSLETK